MSACACVRNLLERQAERELSAAHLFACGVPLAPSLDEKQMLARHCLDELGHFEQVASVAEESGVEDLLALVSDRVRRLPVPASWLEMVVISVSFDTAVYFQLRAYASAPDARISRLATRITADEREHLAAAQNALADLARQSADVRTRLLEHVDRWLPVALGCFDGPDVEQPGCPEGPHTLASAASGARAGYLDSVSALFVPLGVPEARFRLS